MEGIYGSEFLGLRVGGVRVEGKRVWGSGFKM
jgi:hypothetical protein